MTMQINTDNTITLDGRPTGLRVTQRREGTVVYSTSHAGHDYKEHKMPHARYSLAHDAPHAPGQVYDPTKTAGRAQLEADLRVFLAESTMAQAAQAIKSGDSESVKKFNDAVSAFQLASWKAQSEADKFKIYD